MEFLLEQWEKCTEEEKNGVNLIYVSKFWLDFVCICSFIISLFFNLCNISQQKLFENLPVCIFYLVLVLVIFFFMKYFLLKKNSYFRYLLKFDHGFLFDQVGHSLKITWKLMLNKGTGSENHMHFRWQAKHRNFSFQLIPTQNHLELIKSVDQDTYVLCTKGRLLFLYLTYFTFKNKKVCYALIHSYIVIIWYIDL